MIPLPEIPSFPAAQPQSPGILVVEDDEVDFRATRRALSKVFGENLSLDWALTWDEAVTKITDGAYDVYLVDYNLGGRSGVELMRATEDGSGRAFIFLTGQEDRGRDLEATNAGAADFLVKDEVTPARLERSIRYAISMVATQRTLKKQADELRRAHALVQEQAERYLKNAQELATAQRETRRALQRAEESEKRYRILAEHDVLTGLANRGVLGSRMEVAISRTRRVGGVLALMFLDLDRFKRVNDTLGHAIGDKLIIGVGERLTAVVRNSDLVARLGGDEFAVMLTDMRDRSSAANAANKILAAIAEPFVFEGKEVMTRTSIGIALLDDDQDTVESMLNKADTALYKAKHRGRGTFQFFDEELDREVKRRLKLETDLPVAMTQDQLFLEFQPQISLETGTVTAVEAMVRWRHPELGCLGPEAFIALAEATRLITRVTNWVLRKACTQAARWCDRLPNPVPVVVSVSAIDIAEDDFAASVLAILNETGLAPTLLQLELTESAALSTNELMDEQLRQLGEHGIQVAINDFGAGCSSLVHARAMTISRLKVDRMFVGNMVRDQRDAAVVNAMVTLAHHLGIEAVVEGVETKQQLEFLRRLGQVEVQGSLVSQPLDETATQNWLDTNAADAARADGFDPVI